MTPFSRKPVSFSSQNAYNCALLAHSGQLRTEAFELKHAQYIIKMLIKPYFMPQNHCEKFLLAQKLTTKYII